MFPRALVVFAILLFAARIIAADPDLPGPHPGDQLPPYELQSAGAAVTLDFNAYYGETPPPIATLLVVVAPGVRGAAAADTLRTAAALADRYHGSLRLILVATDCANPDLDHSPWRPSRNRQPGPEVIAFTAQILVQQLGLNLPVATDNRARDMWRALGRPNHLALLLDPDRRILHRQESLADPAAATAMATAIDTNIKAVLRRDAAYSEASSAHVLAPVEKAYEFCPSLLALALRSGNLALADRLYSLDHDVDRHFDRSYPSALTWAITAQKPESVRWLLAHHADPLLACPAHPTPLDLAAVSGNHPDIIAMLRSAGAHDSIFTATAAGDLPTIRRIIANDPSRALLCDGADHTPLDVAIIANQPAAFHLLLGAGPYPDAVLATALAESIGLQIGADLPRTDFIQTIIAQYPAIVRMRSYRGCESEGTHPRCPFVTEAFYQASYSHDDALMRQLIALGADLDGTDGSGKTLLFQAIEQEDAGLAKLLLDHGADPNRDRGPAIGGSQDFRDPHPLLIAIDHGNIALVQTLLAHHAHVDRPDSRDRPLQYLIDGGDDTIPEATRLVMVRMLLAAHPTLGFTDPVEAGTTYLGFALPRDLAIAHLLYDAGARLGAGEDTPDPCPDWLKIPPLDPDHPPITNRAREDDTPAQPPPESHLQQ